MKSSSRAGRKIDQAKHAAILRAASERFFTLGFAATSIEHIAQDAGVSKVTIYKHFRDKQVLFTASVEQECERMRDFFDLEKPAGETLRDRLTGIGEAVVAFLSREEMVRFERRIAAETEHNPELGIAFMLSGPQRMLDAFTALLDAMVARGEIQADDTALAAEQFVSMCKGFGDLALRFGIARDREREAARIAGAVEMFCLGYAAER